MHFSPRHEHLKKIKKKLLGQTPSTNGMLVIAAIHGLGGIGKTILARAVVEDDQVRNRFHNGIYWITLGQQSQRVSDALTELIKWLGDPDFKFTNLDNATSRLNNLLRLDQKAVLLIVDDVWEESDAGYFKVPSSSQCAVLVTTRKASVATYLGVQPYDLDVMTNEEALVLLEKYLQRKIDDNERQDASDLAQEVGYLPLALELAAYQIREGFSFTGLVKDLRDEIDRLQLLNVNPQTKEIYLGWG